MGTLGNSLQYWSTKCAGLGKLYDISSIGLYPATLKRLSESFGGPRPSKPNLVGTLVLPKCLWQCFSTGGSLELTFGSPMLLLYMGRPIVFYSVLWIVNLQTLRATGLSCVLILPELSQNLFILDHRKFDCTAVSQCVLPCHKSQKHTAAKGIG